MGKGLGFGKVGEEWVGCLGRNWKGLGFGIWDKDWNLGVGIGLGV
jgi:hypothetical protein